MADRIPAFGSIPPSVVCLALPARVFDGDGVTDVHGAARADRGKRHRGDHPLVRTRDLVAAGVVVTSVPVATCHLLREIRPEDMSGAARRRQVTGSIASGAAPGCR